MPIWHPSPRENDEACLDVLAISDVDDDGLVTIYTRQSAPVQISADWGIGLFTAADDDLISYLAATEQGRWEGER